jgi:predicted dehydrogenase
MVAKIILVGSGPWPTKVKAALEKADILSQQISYSDFKTLNTKKISKLASNSIIWVCTRPANQIQVIERLSDLYVKVILEKPLVTNKKELNKFKKIMKQSHNYFFLSQVWAFSEIWGFLKSNVDFYNITSIHTERFGMNRRTYLSPPQDWLPHDIYLIHDMYGKALLKSKIYRKKLTFHDTAEFKIIVKNGPEIQITGGHKDGSRIMKWELSDQNNKYIFNFIDNSADVLDKSTQNWLHINFEKVNEISRMVKRVGQSSEGDDLITVIKLYNKLLI